VSCVVSFAGFCDIGCGCCALMVSNIGSDEDMVAAAGGSSGMGSRERVIVVCCG